MMMFSCTQEDDDRIVTSTRK